MSSNLNNDRPEETSDSTLFVFQGSQEDFYRLMSLFEDGQLSELLGIEVLDAGALVESQLVARQELEPATNLVNWREWLQNLISEPYWKPPELILAGGKYRGANRDEETGAIANLIQQLQPSRDEPTRRKAAKALGEIGAGNFDAVSTLTALLNSTQDEETRWQAALSLGKIDPSNPKAGVERAKIIDLGMPPDSQTVALIVAFRPDSSEEISVRLRVEPIGDETSLPSSLKLAVLDESGVAVIEAQPTSTDDFLQRELSGPGGEHFSVRLSLEDVSITEDFTI